MTFKKIIMLLFILSGCTSKEVHIESRTPQSEKLVDLCAEKKDYVHFDQRVVTLNNGAPISGDIETDLPNGNYEIRTDYSSRSPAPRGAIMERPKSQLSPAVACLSDFRVQDHVLFLNKGIYAPGIVFEVFANGTLRIIDEDINERYATVRTAFKRVQVPEERQEVIFNLNHKEKATGTLLSQYSNNKVIIKYRGHKLVRDRNYIQFKK